MNVIAYYAETNLIAIIVMVFILAQLARRSFKKDSTIIILRRMIYTEIVICLSDFIAVFFRETSCSCSRFFVYFGNTLFFLATVYAAYLWLIYLNYKLESKSVNHLWVRRCLEIPFYIFLILLLVNPFLPVIFSVDTNNIYHRADGVCIHWIVTYGYMLAASIKGLYYYKKRSVSERKYIIPLILFVVPPLLCCIPQLIVPRITSVQIGIMLSILLTYLEGQQSLVIKDELTGTNNKRALYHYETFLLNHHENDDITVIMMDLDKFKSINDRFGHLEGDMALKDAADIIETACHFSTVKMGLYRYGGDEFITIGTNVSKQNIIDFTNELQNQIDSFNLKHSKDYEIQISAGSASQKCHCAEDFRKLIAKADQAMYLVKNSR